MIVGAMEDDSNSKVHSELFRDQYAEDGVTLRLTPEEAVALKIKWYKSYLGPWYTQPLKDPVERRALRAIFATGELTYRVWVPLSPPKIILPVVQDYILSFGKRVHWQTFSTQELVETYFAKDTNVSAMMKDCQVLIITHSGQEVQHTYNVDLSKQIIGQREIMRKHTLFVAQGTSMVTSEMGCQPAIKNAVTGTGPAKAPI